MTWECIQILIESEILDYDLIWKVIGACGLVIISILKVTRVSLKYHKMMYHTIMYDIDMTVD